jgi:hypothetical protein
MVGINFVNRGGWRDDIVLLSEAITVSGLINSSLNLSGGALIQSLSDKPLGALYVHRYLFK